MASNPAKADVLGFSVALPGVSAVAAEVTKIVAADLTAYMRNALSAPRATHKRQSPTVTIAEVSATTTMETITVVATRLPPLATESLAQAADSHTRL
ncbi:MAG TPA: hypothetical protein VH814_19430 [Steroidobacteraceae bacterium]